MLHQILKWAGRSEIIVAAWGNHGDRNGRGDKVLAMLKAAGYSVFHLGLNKTGQPKHPLYLTTNSQLKSY
jgi:hypothetical protein